MGILFFATVFGFTLAIVTIQGQGWYFPFLIVLFGFGFAYDKK
jgi:hypothetical protein